MKIEYKLGEINNPITATPIKQFCQIYKQILLESYKIFPVPQKFLESILKIIIPAKPLEEKCYSFNSIIKKYTKNWKYYSVFKFNAERMIQKNLNASITIIKFKTLNDITKILTKYPPTELQQSLTLNTKAVIYSYDDNFNLILAVNQDNKTKFQYNKAIQHELIHWMQVVLNAQSYTERGIFNKFKNNITNEQLDFLASCFNYNTEMNNTINYLLSEIEFQPWCANSVENFEYLNLNLTYFQQTIKNTQLFKQSCIKNKNNEYMIQLLLFTEICYIASINNPADDRYWYLIESIKENNKYILFL